MLFSDRVNPSHIRFPFQGLGHRVLIPCGKFLNSSTTNIVGPVFFVVGGCPSHYSHLAASLNSAHQRPPAVLPSPLRGEQNSPQKECSRQFYPLGAHHPDRTSASPPVLAKPQDKLYHRKERGPTLPREAEEPSQFSEKSSW